MESKTFLALLNGISRKLYYGDEEITEEFLKNELYPDMSDNEFETLHTKAANMIKNMASADMDPNQLQAFLTSQTKKKEGRITEEQAAVYQKFWKSHKSRIHESLTAKSRWNNSLKSMTWRIDVQSQARTVDQINTASAIVELQLANPQENNQKSEVVRFEMDHQAMQNMLENLKEIENQIKSHSQ